MTANDPRIRAALRVSLSSLSEAGPDDKVEMELSAPGDPSVLAQRQVLVDGTRRDLVLRGRGAGRHVLTADGERHETILEAPRRAGGGMVREVIVDGFRFEVATEPAHVAALRERARRDASTTVTDGPFDVRAIIPGRVLAVSVGVGERVTAGQQLLIIEAMKMQNELKAPRDGTIDRVGVTPGVNIEVGDLLVVIS